MKNIITMKSICESLGLLALSLSLTISVSAQSQSDSLLVAQQKRIEILEKKCAELSGINSVLKSRIDKVDKDAAAALSSTQAKLDSLCTATASYIGTADSKAGELASRLSETQSTLETKTSSLDESVSTKANVGIGIAALLAVVIVGVFFLLKRSKDRDISQLKKQADELSEKMVGQMSAETDELRKVAEALGKAQSEGTASQDELGLVKRLADKICFIENTLYRMDPSVRGYKQLSKSIKQMKEELGERGYELVDMLGKEYNEGMNLTANLVFDESLPEGARIITSVRKPQINIGGKMVQCADVVVSQNV